MIAPLRPLSLAALVLGLLLAGCSKPADKIVGVWAIDVEATLKADPKTKDLKPDDLEKQVEMARKFMGDMSFEFTKGGETIMLFGKQKRQGTYTVKSVKGNTVTLDTVTKEEKGKKRETLIVVVEGDTLKVTDKKKTMVLTRR